jgi:hypothetical protein
MPNDMVERFILPNSPRSLQCLIHGMGRCALDCSNDFFKAVYFRRHRRGRRCHTSVVFLTRQGHEYQMHMVRHDHGNQETHLSTVIVQAMFEHEVASERRQLPTKVRVECSEMGAVWFLQVREIAAIVVLSSFHPSFLKGSQPRAAAPHDSIRCPRLLLCAGLCRTDAGGGARQLCSCVASGQSRSHHRVTP